MNNIRPLYVAWDHGISPLMLEAAVSGIREVLSIATVADHVNVRLYGAWRESEWRTRDGSLAPFQSIDWYVEQGRRRSRRRNQLDCLSIIDAAQEEPWQKKDPHYDVILLSEDLYPENHANSANYVFGISRRTFGTVLSTWRFLHHSGLNEENAAECFKSTMMHELGHVFGLVSSSRAATGDWLATGHCPPTNRCTMRQSYNVEQSAEHTVERMRDGSFCPECVHDLRSFFR